MVRVGELAKEQSDAGEQLELFQINPVEPHAGRAVCLHATAPERHLDVAVLPALQGLALGLNAGLGNAHGPQGMEVGERSA